MPGLPLDFWQTESEDLAAVLRPQLQYLTMAGAADAVLKLSQLGIHIDDDLVNADAAAWARTHTSEMLNKMNATSSKLTSDVIGNWIETPGATMGDLERALMPILDNNIARASRIAITETTRAYAQGNNLAHVRAGVPNALLIPPAHPNCRCGLAVRRFEDQWVQVWYTDNDEIVCRQRIETPWGIVEGCRALHRVIVSEGQYLGQKS